MNFKRYLPVISVIIGVTAMLYGGKHDGEYLHEVRTTFRTPSLPWAKPLSRPVKALIITPPSYNARDVVELWQRMDIDFEVMTSLHWKSLGRDDIYNAAVRGTSNAEKKQELLRKLQHKYDVYILSNVALNILPKKALYIILEKVSRGAGLVITNRTAYPYKELASDPDPAARDSIMSVISKAALSEDGYSPEKAEKDPRRFKHILNTYRFGEGRIATLNYHGRPHGLTPGIDYSRNWLGSYENCMALVQQAVLWASKHKPQTTFSCNQLDADELASFDQKKLFEKGLVFKIFGKKGISGKILFRVRNSDGTVIWSQETPIEMNKAEEFVSIHPPFLASGTHFIDLLFFREDNGILSNLALASPGYTIENFGLFALKTTSPLGDITFSTDQQSYKPGADIKFNLAFSHPTGENMKLKVLLKDSPQANIWQEKVFDLAKNSETFSNSIKLVHVPTLAGYLDYQILSGNHIIAGGSKQLYFPKTGLLLYFSYVWDGVNTKMPYSAEQLDKAGFDGVLTGAQNFGGQQLNMGHVWYFTRVGIGAGDGGTSNWSMTWTMFRDNQLENRKNKAAIEAKKIAKKPENAKEMFGNDQSFYNPATREFVGKFYRELLKEYSQKGISVYNLGDENHFSYTAGYSPSDQKEFRKFLKERYKTIENLNRQWHTSYGSFDQVEHLKMKDAIAKKNYPAWMDHRAFMEKYYTDVHNWFSKMIKEYDPSAIVGAEGSNSGDLEKTIKNLEFWGPYANRIENELLRSLGPEKLRSMWWGGYVGSHGGRSTMPFALWNPLLTGAANANSWFAGNPGSSETLMAAGLDYAKYFQKLLPHLLKLKYGLAQLLISNPLKDDGLAVYWSHESRSLTLIDTNFYNPNDSISTFIQFCYANGIQLQFVTPTTIAKGALSNKKLLFMFGASSVSEKTKQCIETFAKNGGVVVADINPGITNEYCRPYGKSNLAELFNSPGIKGEKKPVLRSLTIDKKVDDNTISFRAESVYASPETDCFVINKFGKGLGILLNFNLSAAEQTANPKTPFNAFMLDILSIAGIKPEMNVSGINPQRTIIRIRQGNGYQVLGLLDTDKADRNKTATIKWQKKCYVYQADKGLIGHTDQWSMDMKVPFKIYCLFDKEQTAPAIQLSAKVATPGKPLQLNLATFAKGTVLRFELLKPDGTRATRHPDVVVVDGKKQCYDIWFAYNYPEGDYKIVVTDVRTGLTSEQSIQLKSGS